MLLAGQLLALGVGAHVLLWMIVLHRRTRAADNRRGASRRFPRLNRHSPRARRSGWRCAPRSQGGAGGAGLNQPTPCSWRKDDRRARNFSSARRVNGWIIVTGSGLPNPTLRRGRVFSVSSPESAGGSARCNCSTPTGFCIITPGRALEDGCVTRAYAWAGETIWNQGAKTLAEIESSMKCSATARTRTRDSWAAVEWTAANVEKVPQLAARWSLDPARVERTRPEPRQRHRGRIRRGFIELRTRNDLAQSADGKRKELMSFSIELELQKFPKTIKLKDGSKAALRPLRRDDEKEFHQLFLGIPEPERMFIKHRVQDLKVIRDWCQNIDYGPQPAAARAARRQNRRRRDAAPAARRLETAHRPRERAGASAISRTRPGHGRSSRRSSKSPAAPAWKKSRRNSSANRRRR